jgi:hypothetical protein
MKIKEQMERKEQAAKGHGKIKLLFFFVISTFVFFRKLVFQQT